MLQVVQRFIGILAEPQLYLQAGRLLVEFIHLKTQQLSLLVVVTK